MFKMPSGPMTPKMGPCKECGKSTRSHIIGSEHYCHACWKEFPEERKADIKRMQKAREARMLVSTMMQIAAEKEARANIEEATLAKTKKIIELTHTEEIEKTEDDK